MNDELLIKFLLNESSSEETDEVNRWLSLAKENPIYLAQLRKIWIESEKLKSTSKVDVEAAWTKFQDNVTVKPIVKLKIWNTRLRIVAMLALAVSSVALYAIFKSSGYTGINADNQVISQVLPDGSKLMLNKFSHIEFANNFKRNRSIRLDSGDVFFNVTKDKSNPFIIKVDKVEVEVVGTSFNVKHLKQQTEVVVETGIVKVSLGNQHLLLHKGEKVIIAKDALKFNKLPVNDQLYSYYRTNLFIADNTLLTELVATLNEAYGSNIVVDDSAKQETITTTLQYRKSLNENLELIRLTLDKLKVRRNQKEIILSY
ncbi:FecR domain-containing protein [Pedobacter sp. Du54]|uniref:FecR family protein n=1 Tax=Pedobacter anseongensis TaxID=3133439 RepID=UPI0030986988